MRMMLPAVVVAVLAAAPGCWFEAKRSGPPPAAAAPVDTPAPTAIEEPPIEKVAPMPREVTRPRDDRGPPGRPAPEIAPPPREK